MKPNDWHATDSKTASTATATKAGVTNQRHTINYVHASYSSSSQSGLLTVKEGSTTLFTYYVHGADVIPVDHLAAAGAAVSAVLAAGGGGVVGVVTISGTSE